MEPIRHVVAASNFLIGATNFLILALPQGWRIGDGIAPPEVDATHMDGGTLWVVDGRTHHVLFEPAAKRQVELIVRVQPGAARRERVSTGWETGDIKVSGHPATYRIGEVRRGVLKRQRLAALGIAFHCNLSERSLCIEFFGPSSEDLREFLRLAPAITCH